MAGLPISGDHSHHQTSLSPRLSSSGTDSPFRSSITVDFKKLFSLKKEKGQKLFSLPSFTAPDTEVLQSFSGLDSCLKECLEISHFQCVQWLWMSYQKMIEDVKDSTK